MVGDESDESRRLQERLRTLPREIVALRLVGLGSRSLRSRAHPYVARAFLLIVGALMVVSFIVAINGPQPLARISNFLMWCLWYIALAPAIAFGLHMAVTAYGSVANSLSAMLTQQGRIEFYHWNERYLHWRPQVAAASAVAILGPGTLFFADIASKGSSKIPIEWLSYVILVFTGYLVGASAYWVAISFLLMDRWSRPGSLRLLRFSPALTPGIEDLARIAGGTFAACAAYITCLLFPFTVWLRSVSSTNADLEELLLTTIKIVTLGLSMAVTIIGGLLPQLSLSRAVRRQRRASMLELAPKALDGTLESRQEYELVASSPTSTVGSGNAVQLAVGIAAAVAPALLVFIG